MPIFFAAISLICLQVNGSLMLKGPKLKSLAIKGIPYISKKEINNKYKKY